MRQFASSCGEMICISTLMWMLVKRKCGPDVGESYNKPWKYAQLVPDGAQEISLKGTSEHGLMD